MTIPHPIRSAAAMAAVLLAALLIGMGIRQVRSHRIPLVEESRTAELPPLREPVPADMPAGDGEDPVTPDHEHEPTADQEREPNEVHVVAPEVSVLESPVHGEAQGPSPIASPPRDWRQVWNNLNLTAEEIARLREGFRLLQQRWQNMSESQRQTERERLEAMRVRWEGMSEDERHAASQRMRDRFEEWRRSDRVELPELSLD